MAAKGSGRPPMSRNVLISKVMVRLLRHSAEDANIKMDSEGNVKMDALLNWTRMKSLKATFAEAIDVVKASDKQRFALSYTEEGPMLDALKQEFDPNNQHPHPSQTDPTPPSTAIALAAFQYDQDPSHYKIRATQGHSLKTIDPSANLRKLSLTTKEGHPMDLPATVVHGTYHGTWPLILEKGGLLPMGRLHVHFATGPPLEEVLRAQSEKPAQGPLVQNKAKSGESKVISGMRADSQILIYLDLRRALEAGYPFWISENGVVLSEGLSGAGGGAGAAEKIVPLEFFKAVVERKRGLGLLMENGRLVQETPAWMLDKSQAKMLLRGGGGGGGGGNSSGGEKAKR